MDERVKTDVGSLAATLDFDAELMLRVREGDGASFAILLEKHRLPVIHFLYLSLIHIWWATPAPSKPRRWLFPSSA